MKDSLASATTKTLSLIFNPIKDIQNGVITLNHLNIGLIILACIAFFAIGIVFVFNSKKLYTLVSGSLKDPVTNRWSPKILTAFAISAMIVLSHIVWLKAAFIKNDFSQLQPILIIDYAYLTVAYGLRTMEKMQDKKNNIPPNSTSDTANS